MMLLMKANKKTSIYLKRNKNLNAFIGQINDQIKDLKSNAREVEEQIYTILK